MRSILVGELLLGFRRWANRELPIHYKHKRLHAHIYIYIYTYTCILIYCYKLLDVASQVVAAPVPVVSRDGVLEV